jgi:hypothetical protein
MKHEGGLQSSVLKNGAKKVGFKTDEFSKRSLLRNTTFQTPICPQRKTRSSSHYIFKKHHSFADSI